MSETLMTVAFGATNRNNPNPRSIRVLADLVVGGSGVFIFHALGPDGSSTLRLRPVEEVPTAAGLMAGLALADAAIPIDGDAAEVAQRLRALPHDIELTSSDAETLAASVAGFEVTAVVTGVLAAPFVDATDFADTSWTVLVAQAG